MTVKRGISLRGIHVRIRLRVDGKLLATRSARITGVAAKSTDGLRALYCKLR